jgi:hypothetical protein
MISYLEFKLSQVPSAAADGTWGTQSWYSFIRLET